MKLNNQSLKALALAVTLMASTMLCAGPGYCDGAKPGEDKITRRQGSVRPGHERRR